jgi:hypothetical protein
MLNRREKVNGQIRKRFVHNQSNPIEKGIIMNRDQEIIFDLTGLYVDERRRYKDLKLYFYRDGANQMRACIECSNGCGMSVSERKILSKKDFDLFMEENGDKRWRKCKFCLDTERINKAYVEKHGNRSLPSLGSDFYENLYGPTRS